MHLIFVSGLSGSGKSVALQMLEDIGYYCVDNIPAALLSEFVQHAVEADDPAFMKTAIGVDARNRRTDIESVPQLVAKIRHDGASLEVIYLHAETDILLNRYRQTNRRHPLSGGGASLEEAIMAERVILEPISRNADYIIDSSHTSVHDLRELIRARVDREGVGPNAMALQFESFGFKNGMPSDADFVFDVRCLPNPYWDKQLRHLTGRDRPVIEYLDQQDDVHAMFDAICSFLTPWLPKYAANNRSYLTIAVGCTGGQHRSVYMSDRLSRHFASAYANTVCRHTAL
ncbi:MAG: RNase adapter RapZ [Gammaproteobacteria bacterium]